MLDPIGGRHESTTRERAKRATGETALDTRFDPTAGEEILLRARIDELLDPLFDIDGDGETEALTDGLLILRYIFGFRGAALIDGAVDEVSCTRCTAEEIEAYLALILE